MNRKSELRQSINNESGQAMIWTALMFALLLGVGGLTVDLGHGYICYRELQASTDAAALAAASQLPITTSNESSNTVSSTATSYSSVSGNYNAIANLNTPLAMTGAAITVTPGCVNVSGLPQCTSSMLANAVQVTQTVTIPTYFIRVLGVFGIKSATSLKLSATAISQMRGAQRGPYDVAMAIDTTSSMTNPDGGSNCTGSKIQCAEQGAQILMSEFSPCLPGSACGTATNGNVTNPVDELSLFTFPAQTAGSQVGNDEGCTAKTPSEIAYPDSTAYGTVSHSNPTMPPVGTATGDITSANLQTLVNQYQVVPLSSNYRTSDSTTGTSPLTVASSGVTSSNPSIVNAVGGNSYFGGTSCTGMLAKGGEGTFYGGAMFVAQEYLANNSRTNAANVMILLSDGDANGGTMSAGSTNLNNSGSSKGSYPSSTSQCQQAIDIATAAKAAGTKIYVVGYGVASGGCSTDSGLTACQALRSIASSDQNFFVDTSSVKCTGATSVTMNGGTNTLSAIFTAIVGDLTLPRLLPSNTAFTAMAT
jgi:Flp pilus assembly protein TadG